MIDLPIPENNKSPTLIDCFNYYVQGEVLEGENAWYNEDKKERINIRKKILFWSFPNILVIDFKRFNNRFQKNQVLITFPIDDMNDTTISEVSIIDTIVSSKAYVLFYRKKTN